MTVRLYGRAQGNSSHARVTAGFYEALRAAGMLSGFVGLDLGAISDDVQRERDNLAGRGAAADHGVFTGALGRVEVTTQHASHRHRWIMVAPNSNLLPLGLIREIHRVATGLLAPSEWAASVLRALFDLPVICVPHGVTASATPHANGDPRAQLRAHARMRAFAGGEFRVLHLSTSDRERKGTLELLRAWRHLHAAKALPERATLHLILDHEARIRLMERIADEEIETPSVTFLGRVDYAPEPMAEVIGHAHVVCQPSRGEAFGLAPLEALCCGVPIVATACTGHSQYLKSGMAGVRIVPHGELAPMDDLPGAVAPTVRVEDVADALEDAAFRWVDLHNEAYYNADKLSAEWTWHRQLAPFLTKLKGPS